MKKISKLIIFILIIIVVLIILLFMPINNKNIIVEKGNLLFGKSKTCSTIESMTESMTDDLTNRKCILCNKKFIGSSSQRICNDCCNITNRCSVCGKIKSNII